MALLPKNSSFAVSEKFLFSSWIFWFEERHFVNTGTEVLARACCLIFNIFFSNHEDAEELEMPQLCPVSEDVTETNVYNNPPVLTKKSETEDFKDESAVKSDKSEEKCEEENTDESKTNNCSIVSEGKSGNEDTVCTTYFYYASIIVHACSVHLFGMFS